MAIPAIVRRAPRFVRIIGIGAALGVLLGVGLALLSPGRGAEHRTVVAVLVAFGFGIIGAMVAGAIATRNSQDRNPARIGGVFGAAAGAVLTLVLPGDFNRNRILISIVVVVGFGIFGAIFGATSVPKRPSGTHVATASKPANVSKKPAAKKPAAKKPAAKKPAAKKPAAKKPAAKKPAAKKPAAKKPAAKKPAAKKPAAKSKPRAPKAP